MLLELFTMSESMRGYSKRRRSTAEKHSFSPEYFPCTLSLRPRHSNFPAVLLVVALCMGGFQLGLPPHSNGLCYVAVHMPFFGDRNARNRQVCYFLPVQRSLHTLEGNILNLLYV